MSFHDSLGDKVLITQDIASQLSSTNVNGATVDMSGWSGCLFIFNLGAMTGAATFDARVVGSANANMSGATNVPNCVITQVAAAGNTNWVGIDVFRPPTRYIATATMPATNNTQVASFALRYGRTGNLPPTQTAAQLVKVVAS